MKKATVSERRFSSEEYHDRDVALMLPLERVLGFGFVREEMPDHELPRAIVVSDFATFGVLYLEMR